MTASRFKVLLPLLLIAALAAACGGGPAPATPAAPAAPPVPQPAATGPDVAYTLRTGGPDGSLVYVGVGGAIEGQVNPTLTADPGQTVMITLVNGDGVVHDVVIDEFDAASAEISQPGDLTSITFTAGEAGEYAYYCSVPGHRQAGMLGTLRVGEPAAEAATGASIVRHPADLPAPLERRGPAELRVDLVAEEIVGQLADGATMTYFTFNGQVPGPLLRVRVGDTVELHLRNETSSLFPHSIDLHAVTGPGGGAVYTQTPPGGETSFRFQALNPGLYVYHCATPSVAHHIANGMYGLILVEPVGGLPPVDREFYVMQGEIYTAQPFGSRGHLDFSMPAMLNERPEYFVFNGASMALAADEHALRAQVGETVRIFFGVGGPNFTSSFHVIGEIFDRVYPFAALTSPPLTDVQTVSVPPGGAAVVEFRLEVPGRYILVDHALSRLERGLAGFLYAEGQEDPAVFFGEHETAGSGH
jgi:nitrite reductase (NO-forming)